MSDKSHSDLVKRLRERAKQTALHMNADSRKALELIVASADAIEALEKERDESPSKDFPLRQQDNIIYIDGIALKAHDTISAHVARLKIWNAVK